MKKFLALALILTLALSISVFAVTVVPDTDTFPDKKDSNTTVTVSATVGTTMHRYAVDIDYNELQVSVAGTKLVWNTTNMKYDVQDVGTAPDPTTTTANVIFSNRSDLPVYVYYEITDDHPADYLFVNVQGCTAKTKYEIEKATPGVGASNGTAATKTFALVVTADDTEGEANTNEDWAAAATYYGDYFAANPAAAAAGKATIATIAFTVSMNNTPVAP